MLIVLSPVYLAVAILVRIRLGSPVVFCQERPGYRERIFKLYKFRSMTDARDEKGELLPDAVRLTPFGRMLRSTSLDELPEFWNILKGDMSFIGPRPLLVKYLPLYNEHQHRRHDVKPGLTGYAQVNGRNTISWEQKFDYDVWYVDHLSFPLDVKIVFQTVAVVLKHSDINSANDATMEAFTGTPPDQQNGDAT
ncbi:MAG: sugar transferase [Lachnospiraceae bacterium]|nr:sugar transferase [Lachnospiraceae bacterium]